MPIDNVGGYLSITRMHDALRQVHMSGYTVLTGHGGNSGERLKPRKLQRSGQNTRGGADGDDDDDENAISAWRQRGRDG